MMYNKATAFIVPLLLSFLFKVRQEPGDQSDEGHIAADVIDRLYPVTVSHVSQHGRCDPRHPEGKAEEEAGDQPQFIG